MGVRGKTGGVGSSLVTYLHLFADDADTQNAYKLVALDLTPMELRRRFITPWRWRREVIHRNRVWRVEDLRVLRVVETNRSANEELKDLREKDARTKDELARGGIIVLRSVTEQNLAATGADVTTRYFPTGTVSHHPVVVWLERRVGGILVLVAGTVIAATLMSKCALSPSATEQRTPTLFPDTTRPNSATAPASTDSWSRSHVTETP